MNYFAAYNINKMYVGAKKKISGNEILPKLYLTMGTLAWEQDVLVTKFIMALSTEYQFFLTEHLLTSTQVKRRYTLLVKRKFHLKSPFKNC